MEISQLRMRPTYYFSWPDQEILEDHFLSLSCNEETWLYTVDASDTHHKSFELESPSQNLYISKPTVGGMVDSRTFTRRKHCTFRPSLESVVESSPCNRSSLGLLTSSLLLNDTLRYMSTTHSENQEKTFSSSTGSEIKPSNHRVFELDSPFTNLASFGGSKCPNTNYNLEGTESKSSASDFSLPFLPEDCSFGEEKMTESLLLFLEKKDYKDDVSSSLTYAEKSKMDSLSNVPDSCDSHRKDGVMTNSFINFIDPVNCRPPSGFRDNEMTDSVVNIHKVDGFPNCEMTASMNNYLENIKSNSPALLVKPSSEAENIPPIECIKTEMTGDGKLIESNKMNSTYVFEKNGMYELENDADTTYDLNKEINNITFTNTVNNTKKINERSNCNNEMNQTQLLNISYERNISAVQAKSAKCLKVSALNVRDLNLNDMIETNRQIPSKNSTLNTTFTKMSSQDSEKNGGIEKSNFNHLAQSTEMLYCGIEDDTTSSASDSSFSSNSTKPRSVDELRNIAQQQECSLARVTSTSTPTQGPTNMTPSKMGDINISPIPRQPKGGRHTETRSANSSPIRGYQQPLSHQHQISKLSQSSPKVSHQMFPASSVSNISRPKVSGLRMPKPISRFTEPRKLESRPSTVPVATRTQSSQGIPRPQVSRLPMPQFRGSSISESKRRQL